MAMIRVLIGKPGLDGHDKGAKTVAMALKEAGMEVIYTGRRQSIAQILQAAVQEDVDIIGISILSGTHVPVVEDLMAQMKEKKLDDIPVLVGGVIPQGDIPALKNMGVAGVFPVGSTFPEIVAFIKNRVKKAD
jgi:methylmalonyl-CoA mutase, C-terminal domain